MEFDKSKEYCENGCYEFKRKTFGFEHILEEPTLTNNLLFLDNCAKWCDQNIRNELKKMYYRQNDNYISKTQIDECLNIIIYIRELEDAIIYNESHKINSKN